MAHVPLVLPWHRPDPCKPPKMQITAAFKKSYLDYLMSLNIDSELLEHPLTGRMCTIGPSCATPDLMLELLEAGMTSALVLLSKNTQNEVAKLIENLRQAVNEYSVIHNQVYPLAIAVQTRGCAINLGALDNDVPIELAREFQITLTTDEAWKRRGTVSNLYVDYPRLQETIRVGELLFIDGGKVVLEVIRIVDNAVVCKVTAGGTLYNKGQLSIPGVPLDIPNVTDEDREDIEFAAVMGVDTVIAASTRNVDTIKEVRQILGDRGKGVMVFARIDSKQGFDNITDIAREADGILFARGDLVGELPLQKIFIALKIATATCNKLGKPIYVTSHYAQSMITSSIPTQAEVTDISNAILDGADGILLGQPVAIGAHPVECLEVISSICREAEAAVWQSQMFVNLSSLTLPPIDPTHAISISAVEASLKSGAAAILLATTSGRSAQVVARYRPRCHIIAISRYGQVTRQLNVWRGILPVHYTTTPMNDWNKEVNLRLQYGIEFGKEKGLIKPGDPLVLLNGWRQGAGFTNTLRVVYASESYPWVYPHKIPSQKLTSEPRQENVISQKDTEVIYRKSSINEENNPPKPEALGITSVN